MRTSAVFALLAGGVGTPQLMAATTRITAPNLLPAAFASGEALLPAAFTSVGLLLPPVSQ